MNPDLSHASNGRGVLWLLHFDLHLCSKHAQLHSEKPRRPLLSEFRPLLPGLRLPLELAGNPLHGPCLQAQSKEHFSYPLCSDSRASQTWLPKC